MSSGVSRKRKNPFGESNHFREKKNLKKDVEAIYEKTLNILMNGGQNRKKIMVHRRSNITGPTSLSKCFVCNSHAESVKCSSCSNTVCLPCTRACDGDECADMVYCSNCTIINYDQSQERVFCLNCNDNLPKNYKGKEN
eukprot:TRINITY_DN6547_c0_g1_i1.p1 TRINITY_DN6547_c0_g1~~TRINITY_DN6547_c0_g1_i1.p1  ORF type:complete len:139 (-),score=12.51 TRINITY_DN6547_c0_g1_i1:151-567(-)